MAEEAENKYETEEWVYLGQKADTLAHLWRDADGMWFAYKKLPAKMFGGIYWVRVYRPAPDDPRVSGDPVWAGRYAEDAASIQVRAMGNEATIKAKRLEKNTTRTALIDEALAPLLEICKNMQFNDVSALETYVRRKMWEARG